MSDLTHPITGKPMESLPATTELPCRYTTDNKTYCNQLVQVTVAKAKELKRDGQLHGVRCMTHTEYV